MPYTKFGYDWSSSFGEEAQNAKSLRTTDDDGRERIAIGHLSFTQVT